MDKLKTLFSRIQSSFTGTKGTPGPKLSGAVEWINQHILRRTPKETELPTSGTPLEERKMESTPTIIPETTKESQTMLSTEQEESETAKIQAPEPSISQGTELKASPPTKESKHPAQTTFDADNPLIYQNNQSLLNDIGSIKDYSVHTLEINVTMKDATGSSQDIGGNFFKNNEGVLSNSLEKLILGGYSFGIGSKLEALPNLRELHFTKAPYSRFDAENDTLDLTECKNLEQIVVPDNEVEKTRNLFKNKKLLLPEGKDEFMITSENLEKQKKAASDFKDATNKLNEICQKHKKGEEAVFVNAYVTNEDKFRTDLQDAIDDVTASYRKVDTILAFDVEGVKADIAECKKIIGELMARLESQKNAIDDQSGKLPDKAKRAFDSADERMSNSLYTLPYGLTTH